MPRNNGNQYGLSHALYGVYGNSVPIFVLAAVLIFVGVLEFIAYPNLDLTYFTNTLPQPAGIYWLVLLVAVIPVALIGSFVGLAAYSDRNLEGLGVVILASLGIVFFFIGYIWVLILGVLYGVTAAFSASTTRPPSARRPKRS